MAANTFHLASRYPSSRPRPQGIVYLFGLLFLAAFVFGASTIPKDGVSRSSGSQQLLLQDPPQISIHNGEENIKVIARPDSGNESTDQLAGSQTLRELIHALDVLQKEYFEVWQGIWPTTIDWTSAVMGTFVSASLSSLSASFSVPFSPAEPGSESDKAAENLINKFYSQLVSSYFGQDAFALRQQAFDDMLWVVLGWLESIKFITIHSTLHYKSRDGSPWYGKQWVSAFAHRARIFWELAAKGWDTTLCDGGMVWSPYLEPYKNAITNELYITASVSMYLYFPGDDNDAPFKFEDPQKPILAPPHDRKYLIAAINAYNWLVNSNMTNAKGLYVDGFHISRYQRPGQDNNYTSPNTRCDARNEMVYTYNQGVLLSGQRGLFEATGRKMYLEDGHWLIESVIAATGYDLYLDHVTPEKDGDDNGLGRWYGLGRRGVLEEACDSAGQCSQDGQTFKGIFFHHFALFCAQLPVHILAFEDAGNRLETESYGAVQDWHEKKCARYARWVAHNARAALTTRDENGKFGMWWGAPRGDESLLANLKDDEIVKLPDQAVDYRNEGLLRMRGWRQDLRQQSLSGTFDEYVGNVKDGETSPSNSQPISAKDLNDRGRGRTVETQGGGLAVLRALWELVDRRKTI
ncbi:glycosyl hydrolase [Xylogone sp. PMI_703]|nr:glycosyl hydrolase [Xylogone sp. PMI_703]